MRSIVFCCKGRMSKTLRHISYGYASGRRPAADFGAYASAREARLSGDQCGCRLWPGLCREAMLPQCGKGLLGGDSRRTPQAIARVAFQVVVGVFVFR